MPRRHFRLVVATAVIAMLLAAATACSAAAARDGRRANLDRRARPGRAARGPVSVQCSPGGVGQVLFTSARDGWAFGPALWRTAAPAGTGCGYAAPAGAGRWEPAPGTAVTGPSGLPVQLAAPGSSGYLLAVTRGTGKPEKVLPVAAAS